MKEKILVASPTSRYHNHLINAYVEQFLGFTFDRKYLLLVEAGPQDSDDYYKFLKAMYANLLGNSLSVIKGPWAMNYFERLMYARNLIRHFASNYNFSHILFLDTDTFIPRDSIEMLLNHKKDLVGIPCSIKRKDGTERICCLKSGNLLLVKRESDGELVKTVDFYDESELMSQKPNLIKVYSTAMSPLLVSRKVFEKTPFRHVPTHPMGEDVAWHIENNDNGFEYFIDTSLVSIHKQVDWRKMEMIQNPNK